MNLAQTHSEMTSNIREICKTAGCPVSDDQLIHISNILISYADKLNKQNGEINQAKGIIKTLLDTHTEKMQEIYTFTRRIATEFLES